MVLITEPKTIAQKHKDLSSLLSSQLFSDSDSWVPYPASLRETLRG